ncbi:hypothetical protein [Psychroserpens sp.]|uniref:hypothetical protein n=1 Tax=Psychroserpens sp. TaxID=2020870 RepID=UPI001B06F20D|nr:hypothetical protein [Psychroserpens sp.]MBO6608021.1 hypothetical protein [Psychroserpens sp.]MBO6632501.1 hypothetical protein [Psychroserpens sp.]MBO6654852.1 hypothetical protein [Psychroserpens sp.]MBO6683074.1 hypothetical protein [Psychroserpens sp.]MBO6751379.1 hypothetical protein [Psychroserpens sp.]
MRIFIKLCLVALLFTACDETESAIFDPATGQTGIGFGTDVIDVSVPVGGITTTAQVFSTTVSNEARSFNVSVADSNLPAGSFTVGTVSIPAGSHEGSLDVTFNYDSLEDFVEYLLEVNVETSNGVQAFGSLTYTLLREFDINEFVCQDLTLEINFDNFGSENTWEIVDSSSNIVFSGGPYTDGTAGTTITEDLSFAPGDYTMTFFDSYGDGLFDGNNTGSYNLFCTAQAVVSYAGAVGNFGSENVDNFTINDN